jgi:hypothetical protein
LPLIVKLWAEHCSDIKIDNRNIGMNARIIIVFL